MNNKDTNELSNNMLDILTFLSDNSTIENRIGNMRAFLVNDFVYMAIKVNERYNENTRSLKSFSSFKYLNNVTKDIMDIK